MLLDCTKIMYHCSTKGVFLSSEIPRNITISCLVTTCIFSANVSIFSHNYLVSNNGRKVSYNAMFSSKNNYN